MLPARHGGLTCVAFGRRGRCFAFLPGGAGRQFGPGDLKHSQTLYKVPRPRAALVGMLAFAQDWLPLAPFPRPREMQTQSPVRSLQ